MTSKPNILWICTDQQRWDTLGCYGNRWVHTPNIDQLAEGGVLFERAYAQSPVCSPSRASFLTGRYPRTTRCRQNGQTIDSDEVLVTEILARNGYTCGLSGKLHLAPCHPSVTPDIEHRIRDGYSVFHWSHGPRPQWRLSDYTRWLRDQGVEYSTSVSPHSSFVEIGMSASCHQTKWCTDRAVDFIRDLRDAGAPWCFTVNIYDPHHPFDPPEEYLDRYLGYADDIPLPVGHGDPFRSPSPFHELDHRGAYNNRMLYPYDAMTDRDHRLVRAAYWAMVDLIDEQVGRLILALEESDQRKDTIIIYSSDHGEMLGDHGIYLKGPYFYEPAVHVPLIISYPGVTTPGRVGGLVELTDLAPTMLELCSIPLPDGVQGRSFRHALSDVSARLSIRSDVYSEYYNAMPWHREPLPFATMVRDESHKLTRYHDTASAELYSLDDDPIEVNNLWSEPSAVSTKCRMLELMTDRMAHTVDPLPSRKAPW